MRIKVTTYLSIDEAFRTALAQFLYGHMQFASLPRLVMLLDRPPEARRIALAMKLGVVVVVEHAEGEFGLLNSDVASALTEVFAGAAHIDMELLFQGTIENGLQRYKHAHRRVDA